MATWSASTIRLTQSHPYLKFETDRLAVRSWPSSGLLACFGADGETRTPTAFATAPSRRRVYQFHHVGMTGPDICTESDFYIPSGNCAEVLRSRRIQRQYSTTSAPRWPSVPPLLLNQVSPDHSILQPKTGPHLPAIPSMHPSHRRLRAACSSRHRQGQDW